jgi:hypothetical protein
LLAQHLSPIVDLGVSQRLGNSLCTHKENLCGLSLLARLHRVRATEMFDLPQELSVAECFSEFRRKQVSSLSLVIRGAEIFQYERQRFGSHLVEAANSSDSSQSVFNALRNRRRFKFLAT